MNNPPQPLTLVLGATAKTGSRVARSLPGRGCVVRTAARRRADMRQRDRRAERQRGEAFVDAEGIAAVAAATLVDPVQHAGRAYAPTRPATLTLAEAADALPHAVGRTITYRDIDRDACVEQMVRGGVFPASTATCCARSPR